MSAALSTFRHTRQASTKHIRGPGERLVGLVDGIAPKNHGVAADSRLGIDHRISPDHRSALPHLPADIQAPKENEDAARQISLHLHRAEEAGGVMHLLARSNKDILPHIPSVPRCPAKVSRAQKIQNES